MAFPVPPDARASRDFEIVLGGEELLRQSLPIYDTTDDIDEGEWGIIVVDSGVEKFDKCPAAKTIADPAVGAKCVWTKYREGDSNNGQADAMGTKQVELISGTYQARTKLFKSGETYTPGFLLVVCWDAVNLRGILAPVDPAAPITALQLACAVGKVLGMANGVLHYEVPA